VILGAPNEEDSVDDAKKTLWTKIVSDFELSGQTQREFAEARQIELSRLRYWLYSLRNASRPLATEKEDLSGQVVVAIAGDGYQAAFSCAELSDEIGATKVLVVWRIDGEPLRPKTGPFRLVAVTDNEGSRSVFQRVRLVVVDVTQPRR
jgi:hypothetical protein